MHFCWQHSGLSLCVLIVRLIDGTMETNGALGKEMMSLLEATLVLIKYYLYKSFSTKI